MSMELYFYPLACSLASRISLYEANAPARFVELDNESKRALEGGQALADLNPLELVPTLRTDSGELLTENAAILQHIADAFPSAQLAPAAGFERTRLQEWLCFIGTELHKGLFVPLLDEKAPEGAKHYALQKYRSRLDHLERRLQGREFLLDHFSVADAYLFVVLNWSVATPIKLTSYPTIHAYYERLRARPSFARALTEELAMFRNERARQGKPLPAAIAS
jgi:glutathione S-transferase